MMSRTHLIQAWDDECSLHWSHKAFQYEIINMGNSLKRDQGNLRLPLGPYNVHLAFVDLCMLWFESWTKTAVLVLLRWIPMSGNQQHNSHWKKYLNLSRWDITLGKALVAKSMTTYVIISIHQMFSAVVQTCNPELQCWNRRCSQYHLEACRQNILKYIE